MLKQAIQGFARPLAVLVVGAIALVIAPSSASAATWYSYQCFTKTTGSNQQDRLSDGQWFPGWKIEAHSRTTADTWTATNNICSGGVSYVVEAGLIMQPMIAGVNRPVCVLSGSGYVATQADHTNSCTDNGVWDSMRIYDNHRPWFSGTPVDDQAIAVITPF